VTTGDIRFLLVRVIALGLTLAVLFPGEANAYVGPGAGLSALGTLIAFVAAVVLSVIGFVWYPIKRLLRRLRVSRDVGTAKSVAE
jgi:hypothetical protein